MGEFFVRRPVTVGRRWGDWVEIESGVSTNQRVVADFEDNPELLAGFRVQVGSKVFDGSLVGQVDRLSREMLRE